MINPIDDMGDLTLHRTSRSGYWDNLPKWVRLSFKNYEDPLYDGFGKIGFRVVRNK